MNGGGVAAIVVAVVVFLVVMYFVLKWLKDKYPTNELLSKLPFKGGEPPITNLNGWTFVDIPKAPQMFPYCFADFNLRTGYRRYKTDLCAEIYGIISYADVDNWMEAARKTTDNGLIIRDYNLINTFFTDCGLTLGNYIGKEINTNEGLEYKFTNGNGEEMTRSCDIISFRLMYEYYDVLFYGESIHEKEEGSMFEYPKQFHWTFGVCEHTDPLSNVVYMLN